MRIALALAAFLAFLPNAHADDTSNKQFTHDAEFRVRYVFEDNQAGSSNRTPSNGNTVEQRLKLGGTYKVSEKFAVTATMIDAMTWGSPDLYVLNSNGTAGPFSAGDGIGVHNGSANGNNLLMVSEAYATWMVSDDTLLRFGRSSMTMGDGSVISQNDYEPFPYSFDGVLGTHEWDFGRLSAWAVKLAQYDNGQYATMLAANNNLTGGAGLSGATNSDPEADSYGLTFDLKRMPEWLKLVNVHLILTNKDATPGAMYGTFLNADPLERMGQRTIRYGLALGGALNSFDYKADVAGVTGNYSCIGSMANECNGNTAANGTGGTNSALTTLDTTSYMAQAELGWNFPDFMKARLYVKFHYDSGDNQAQGSQTRIGTYDPYFYDKISGSGLMEVVGWGNLTYYNAGLSVSPTDQTNVGLGYFYFQKSNANGGMNPGEYGYFLAGNTATDSTSLGQEVDLSAEHHYDGGFSILARAGIFMPGTAIKDGLGGNPTLNSMYSQVMVQGKMAF